MRDILKMNILMNIERKYLKSYACLTVILNTLKEKRMQVIRQMDEWGSGIKSRGMKWGPTQSLNYFPTQQLPVATFTQLLNDSTIAYGNPPILTKIFL